MSLWQAQKPTRSPHLKEAQVLIEAWRRHYNAIRPHGSLGYRPPAPEMIVPPSWPPGSATPVTQLGGETVNALTFQPDQSPGAGHRYIRIALQGFVPGGTSPQASASANIFDRTVTTLLAW